MFMVAIHLLPYDVLLQMSVVFSIYFIHKLKLRGFLSATSGSVLVLSYLFHDIR